MITKKKRSTNLVSRVLIVVVTMIHRHGLSSNALLTPKHVTSVSYVPQLRRRPMCSVYLWIHVHYDVIYTYTQNFRLCLLVVGAAPRTCAYITRFQRGYKCEFVGIANQNRPRDPRKFLEKIIMFYNVLFNVSVFFQLLILFKFNDYFNFVFCFLTYRSSVTHYCWNKIAIQVSAFRH